MTEVSLDQEQSRSAKARTSSIACSMELSSPVAPRIIETQQQERGQTLGGILRRVSRAMNLREKPMVG